MLGLGKSTYHHIWNNESRPLRALTSQGSGLMMHQWRRGGEGDMQCSSLASLQTPSRDGGEH